MKKRQQISHFIVLDSVKSPTVTAGEKGQTTYISVRTRSRMNMSVTESSPPRVNPPTPMSATRPPTTDKPMGSSLE